MSTPPAHANRRLFLRHAVMLAAAGVAAPVTARAAVLAGPQARSLALEHTHTGERLELLYALRDAYVPAALQTLNHFLRDHYTGEVGVIDPELFDLLYRLRTELGARNSFQVISGYRCPATNGMLKATRGAGSPGAACTWTARPSISGCPACRSHSCAMQRCRWAPAAWATTRASSSSTSTPVACAAGSAVAQVGPRRPGFSCWQMAADEPARDACSIE